MVSGNCVDAGTRYLVRCISEETVEHWSNAASLTRPSIVINVHQAYQNLAGQNSVIGTSNFRSNFFSPSSGSSRLCVKDYTCCRVFPGTFPRCIITSSPPMTAGNSVFHQVQRETKSCHYIST